MIVEAEKIKFKQISDEERAIYLKRMLRFKYPPDKYRRVYEQILTVHSIEPKISKKVFNSLCFDQIKAFVSEIWNYNQPHSGAFAQSLYEDEIRCFDSRKMIEELLGIELDDKWNQEKVYKLLTDLECDFPLWVQNYDELYVSLQSDYPLVLPDIKQNKIQKVILVEGATEEILLPKFASVLGFDFVENGIFVIASGGKNQVVKDYLFNRENLKLPIGVILDSDATEQLDDISCVLRPQDGTFLVEDGEFEDILPLDLILKTLNFEFKNINSVQKDELAPAMPMSQKLYELYKLKGFGEFKKVEFAKAVFEYVKTKDDVGAKIQNLIDFIRQV
ncbi:MAG: hypothetical protein PHE78_02925 [Candidatus Gastranaerophilales bacterium]|nr:hypothetical protein [Candidatus Gastranaerophilales bacterium]